MRDTSTRVFTLMCALVVVWVGVYWFYEPGEPPVTFDSRADAVAGGEATVRPDPLAQLSPGSQPGGDTPHMPAAVKQTQPGPTSRTSTKPIATGSSSPGSRVVPPKFREYVVQQGDTSLQVIARKLLGDSKHWHAIASANKYVDPRKLIPGRTRLLIPEDPGNVEGLIVPPDSPAKPDSQVPPRTPESAPAASAAEFTAYVIQSQDTLSGIAKAHYGKSSLWRLIYDANLSAIPDPDHLKVGTTIQIPKKPE